MSTKSQKKNMQTIYELVSQGLGYIYGDRESGPNGAKKQFHTKSKAFLRALAKDLGFNEVKVYNNYAGIAVSGEITLMGLWADGNGVYFQLNEPLQPFFSFLYRSITHMKDYRGGPNLWMDCKLFERGDYEAVIKLMMALKNPETAADTAKYADIILPVNTHTGAVNRDVA